MVVAWASGAGLVAILFPTGLAQGGWAWVKLVSAAKAPPPVWSLLEPQERFTAGKQWPRSPCLLEVKSGGESIVPSRAQAGRSFIA
jgi:hypothetical protein